MKRLTQSYNTLINENKTAWERKLERISHDPIRYEKGGSNDDYLASAPTIKAVRLG